VALQQIVEQTVTGLGYDLVEIERSAGGLLRITIDLPWQAPEEGAPELPEQFVTVEDCERSRASFSLRWKSMVRDYARLEVSSPGIDRLLRHEQDFIRFEGSEVDLTLKAPIGAAGGDKINANRKKFRGTLERTEEGGWQIVWSDEPPQAGRARQQEA
jgi:ribosome maturation factor RimP